MSSIDFTNYHDISFQSSPKTIATFSLVLSKQDILNALGSESIYINGKYYKVPEIELLELLYEYRFRSNIGNIEIDLEEIKTT
jgi:hypothetical protein